MKKYLSTGMADVICWKKMQLFKWLLLSVHIKIISCACNKWNLIRLSFTWHSKFAWHSKQTIQNTYTKVTLLSQNLSLLSYISKTSRWLLFLSLLPCKFDKQDVSNSGSSIHEFCSLLCLHLADSKHNIDWESSIEFRINQWK